MVDIRLKIGGHQLFGDVIGLDHDVAVGIRHQLVDTAREQVARIVADHRTKPQVRQVGRAEAILVGDRHARQPVGVGDEADEGFIGGQALFAIGIIDPELNRAKEALQLAFDFDAVLPELVLDDAVVVIAVLAAADPAPVDPRLIPAPTQGAGQLDQVIVAIVEGGAEDGPVAVAGETDRVGRADVGAAPGAGIAFEDQFVAVGFRHADVGRDIPAVVAFPAVVPTEAVELCIALEHVVAHDALDVREAAGARKHELTARIDIGDRQLGGVGAGGIIVDVEAERKLDAALDLVILEVRVEGVERRGEIGGGPPLHRSLEAKARELGRGRIAFGAADHHRARRGASAGITPGVEFLNLVGLVDIGCRKRHAERVVGELVDEDAVHTVAVFLRTRVQLAEVGPCAANPDRDRPLAIVERANGAQVDGARKPLSDDRGHRRLVNEDLVHDLGRILVILDRPIVAGRGLLAAVEQGRREVRRKAADRNRVRTARDTLRGQAGQARDRFGDRRVG